MVKQIVRDVFFLSQPSEPATKADIQVGKDLQDTLQANRERCVGMAANMIGVKKNIIIVNMGFIDVVMFNPVIVSKRDMYETAEAYPSNIIHYYQKYFLPFFFSISATKSNCTISQSIKLSR